MGMVCINPDEIREYETGGGKFRIGVLTKDIASKVLAEINAKNFLEAHWLACRHGVKGHEGLAYADGTAVPFIMEKDAKGREVVAEKTLNVYLVSQVLIELGAEIVDRGAGPKVRAVRERRGEDGA